MGDMDPARWSRVRALVEGALDREGAAREAYLESACDGDAELLLPRAAQHVADAFSAFQRAVGAALNANALRQLIVSDTGGVVAQTPGDPDFGAFRPTAVDEDAHHPAARRLVEEPGLVRWWRNRKWRQRGTGERRHPGVVLPAPVLPGEGDVGEERDDRPGEALPEIDHHRPRQGIRGDRPHRRLDHVRPHGDVEEDIEKNDYIAFNFSTRYVM